MNRDDIIRMAREAGCLDESHYGSLWADKLIDFAALVATAERTSVLSTQSTHAEVESLQEELAEAYAEMRKMTEQVESAKPVAWAYVNSDGEFEQIEYETPPDDPSVTPLYLHPKTLTDEDISVLWYQSGEQPFKFARMLLK